MQTKKMSLANIQGKLSRLEMKNIMAGSGGSSLCGLACSIDIDCRGDQHCNYCLAGKGTNGGCGCGDR